MNGVMTGTEMAQATGRWQNENELFLSWIHPLGLNYCLRQQLRGHGTLNEEINQQVPDARTNTHHMSRLWSPQVFL